MGIIATRPTARTQASVSHAAGLPSCKPPKRSAPGDEDDRQRDQRHARDLDDLAD